MELKDERLVAHFLKISVDLNNTSLLIGQLDT